MGSSALRGMGLLACESLTHVYRPHDAECRSADVLEGFLPSQHFPDDDPKGEDVTLLTVITALKHLKSETKC